ncbi:hypothetical protein [Tamlana flava]|uniref:hypothetical protein n=1 Tax=Tamlana flava TaxID=3158572 RepID=UPI00351BDE84
MIELEKLANLKFEIKNNIHCVSLIDKKGFEIIKGYGKTIIDAINDLHSRLH